MEADFWQERWREGRTAFHEKHVNALLVDHYKSLALSPGDTVFVPFCGKSFDLDWLREKGHRVVGAELNKPAVEEVFERQGLVPSVNAVGSLTRYQTGSLDVFVGDMFELSSELVGPVHAIYDRAALIALPALMRRKYADHLSVLSGHARQLLITLDYDQSQMDGPPFSVNGEQIQDLYGDRYSLEPLSSGPISGPLSERCNGLEKVWLLKPNPA